MDILSFPLKSKNPFLKVQQKSSRSNCMGSCKVCVCFCKNMLFSKRGQYITVRGMKSEMKRSIFSSQPAVEHWALGRIDLGMPTTEAKGNHPDVWNGFLPSVEEIVPLGSK